MEPHVHLLLGILKIKLVVPLIVLGLLGLFKPLVMLFVFHQILLQMVPKRIYVLAPVFKPPVMLPPKLKLPIVPPNVQLIVPGQLGHLIPLVLLHVVVELYTEIELKLYLHKMEVLHVLVKISKSLLVKLNSVLLTALVTFPIPRVNVMGKVTTGSPVHSSSPRLSLMEVLLVIGLMAMPLIILLVHVEEAAHPKTAMGFGRLIPIVIVPRDQSPFVPTISHKKPLMVELNAQTELEILNPILFHVIILLQQVDVTWIVDIPMLHGESVIVLQT